VWPFEGRELEIERIRAAYAGSDVDVVLITGPAGIGKTRLAREVVAGLGARTFWVSGTRAAGAVPFGAVASLVPDGAALGGSVEVMRATARRLRQWAARERIVAVVDDGQFLDEASAALIAYLTGQQLAFVVMTARPDLPVADALVRLAADDRGISFELPGLPEDAIDRLIAHTTPSLDARARHRLRRLAGGNPLALRELLHGGQRGGLTHMITSRVEHLDPASRRVVEFVACGEPLAVDILDRLVGLDALTDAEDRGLIVVERSGDRRQVRLDHPLYGEVVRQNLTISRAMCTYRGLADALLATPLRRRGDLLQAAIWQLEAGLVRRPGLILAGARLAIGQADLQLAERLARAARAAQPGDEADHALAEILAYQGRTQEAAEVLPSEPPAEPAGQAEWAVTRAETLYWGAGDLAAALSTMDIYAEDTLVRASRSWLLFFDGQCIRSASEALGVLDDPEAEPKAVIWASASAVAATGFLGRGEEAERLFARTAPIAAAYADSVPWGAFEVAIGGCLAQLAAGRPIQAQQIASAGYEMATQGGAAMMLPGWALHAGLSALARGHVDEAHRLLDEAHAGFAVNDTFRLAYCCQVARAAAAALRRDPDADLFLTQADAGVHPSNRVFLPWTQMWRAWFAYAQGDLPSAMAGAALAAELAREAGMPAVEALALYDIARLGGKPDPARLDEIDHDLARLAATAIRALRSGDGAEDLQAVAQRFAALGYDLHAAEAYTAAGRQHRRNGRFARAELAAAEAAKLSVPQVRTPLLQATDIIAILSPRERDVVLLAAHHTSAEIADRLGLAVPTVNNNLARAYTKLGITGRGQLRTLLSTARSR
jgi:DNA-binding CsgD family transcriptional regulator